VAARWWVAVGGLTLRCYDALVVGKALVGKASPSPSYSDCKASDLLRLSR
jgi:hypothetical protein